ERQGGGEAVISGVPLAVGSHEVAVRIDDDSPASPGVTRSFVLEVGRARTNVQVVPPPVVQAGVPIPVAVRVVAEGHGAPSGTLHVEGGDGERCSVAAPGGTCTLEFREAGGRTIRATYEGDGNFEAAAETEVRLEVIPKPRTIHGAGVFFQ
ncbi:MAG TPA: hypothetical protein VLL75_01545, partial [Vicinamibacteria bacterium]|nr:hypothetical protein [Vicinamibacteria bacterium]